MIALPIAKTAVQPHSRLQSRTLSTTDWADGEASSSFDIVILPFPHSALRTLALPPASHEGATAPTPVDQQARRWVFSSYAE